MVFFTLLALLWSGFGVEWPPEVLFAVDYIYVNHACWETDLDIVIQLPFSFFAQSCQVICATRLYILMAREQSFVFEIAPPSKRACLLFTGAFSRVCLANLSEEGGELTTWFFTPGTGNPRFLVIWVAACARFLQLLKLVLYWEIGIYHNWRYRWCY